MGNISDNYGAPSTYAGIVDYNHSIIENCYNIGTFNTDSISVENHM